MTESKNNEKRVKSSDMIEESSKSSYATMDENLKEILKKIQKEKKASKEEVEKLAKEALESINFVEKIDEINLEFDKYVIFTDGNEQLIYEDGEFYVVSSTDANKKREKKKKEEAKNMYLEYFIRYILNPIIKQRDVMEHSKSISNPTIEKSKTKKKVKEKIKEDRTSEKESRKSKVKVKKEIDDINF